MFQELRRDADIQISTNKVSIRSNNLASKMIATDLTLRLRNFDYSNCAPNCRLAEYT